MIRIVRTSSENQDFVRLVSLLDADLAVRDGDDHPFYDRYNKIDKIRYAAVAHEQDKCVSCGAIREFLPGIVEIKRMYTLPEFRGRGIATLILKELEGWAFELSFTKCILETGKKQPEAIRLYRRNGYTEIPNFGPYVNIENSICFEKILR